MTDLALSIDGIQPEKGHETVYVVRELRAQRVWFAESLLSSATPEIQGLIRRARLLGEQLETPVCGWISDKHDAFVTAIAAEFPGPAPRMQSSLPPRCRHGVVGGRQPRKRADAAQGPWTSGA